MRTWAELIAGLDTADEASSLHHYIRSQGYTPEDTAPEDLERLYAEWLTSR
jgi:hypothetical protein